MQEAPAVLYDACVLYPAAMRDLLLRIAITGVIRARWTVQILDECFRAIAAQRPELSLDRLARTRELMIAAVPDCLVTGYEPLIEKLSLPDPGDRHVLAGAIHSDARAIVTFNLRDFPAGPLAEHRIEALHPDQFVIELLNRHPDALCRVLREQAAELLNPPRTPGEVLGLLADQGLPRAMARFRELLEDGKGG